MIPRLPRGDHFIIWLALASAVAVVIYAYTRWALPQILRIIF